MLTKEKVIKTISNLPEKFSLDELVEKMIVLEKIEKGLEDSEKDNVLTEDELEEKIKEWSK
jgi:predicted transcriptional regulator